MNSLAEKSPLKMAWALAETSSIEWLNFTHFE